MERYEQYHEKKDVSSDGGIYRLCTLVDLSRALPRLTATERQALFLVGLAGLSVRAAGELLGVPRMTMHRRYTYALERLVTYMNGGH